jgi:hypothetical protein
MIKHLPNIALADGAIPTMTGGGRGDKDSEGGSNEGLGEHCGCLKSVEELAEVLSIPLRFHSPFYTRS